MHINILEDEEECYTFKPSGSKTMVKWRVQVFAVAITSQNGA